MKQRTLLAWLLGGLLSAAEADDQDRRPKLSFYDPFGEVIASSASCLLSLGKSLRELTAASTCLNVRWQNSESISSN